MTFLPIQICAYNMTDPIDLNTNPKVDFIPNPKPTNIVIRVTWCMTLWLILMSREAQCMFTCLRGCFWELNPWAINLAKNWNIYGDVLGDHHLEVLVINEGVYQLGIYIAIHNQSNWYITGIYWVVYPPGSLGK